MLWFIIGIIVVAVLLGLYWISIGNQLVRLKNDADAAKSVIDVQLQRRYELIPNLVNTVKGFAKHESETLEKVIAARNAVGNASSFAGKVEADNQLSQTLGHLFAVSESYPDLKANQNFLALQEELTTTENRIAGSRSGYISSARDFNAQIAMFPSSMVANKRGYKPMELFTISPEKREVPKVEF